MLEAELREGSDAGVSHRGRRGRGASKDSFNANNGLHGVLKSNEYGVFRNQTAGGWPPRVTELVTRAVTGARAGRICRFLVVPGARELEPLRVKALVPGSTHVLRSLWRGRQSGPAMCFQNVLWEMASVEEF